MVETLDQDILVNQIIAMAENGRITNWSNSLVILSSTIAFRSDIRSKLHSKIFHTFVKIELITIYVFTNYVLMPNPEFRFRGLVIRETM